MSDGDGRPAEAARVTDILESITDAFLALDRDGRFTYVNRQAEIALRKTRAELLGHNVWEKFPESVGTPFQRNYEAARAAGEVVHYEEYYGPLKAWFEVHIYPAPEGHFVYFRDVTGRKMAEERLRALTHRLLEVQEQERRHLARELHDEVGEVLTGLNFALQACACVPAEEVPARLAQAQELVRDLSSRVRDLSLRLRPTMLDDLGLVPALLWLFERYTAPTGVRVSFEHDGAGRRFPADVETAAYRIVQEALTNVARHARAAEAVVRLWADAAALGVQVEDEGSGFDPASVPPGATGGLSGMQERVTLLGGRLEIASRPGGGTRLTAELPLGSGRKGEADGTDAAAGR